MNRDRRRAEAHRLAGDGVGVREIARRLGVNASTISRDLREPRPEIEPVANLQDDDGRPIAGAELGNQRALQHGAHAVELVEARARGLAPQVLEANPHLEPGRDGPGVRRYVIALARCERVYAWLAEQDDAVFVDAGKVHGVYVSPISVTGVSAWRGWPSTRLAG